MMAFLTSFIFLSTCASVVVLLPYNPFEEKLRVEFESSGVGSDQPVQGVVKVVQQDPQTLTQSWHTRRGLANRRALSHSSRLPFPAFLSRGRPALAPAHRGPVSPLHNLHARRPMETEVKKKKGMEMWRKVIDKESKTSVPVSLRQTKQTCAAVPFIQHVTADGCQTVIVHNRLCFGQCSSLFVPSEGEFAELSQDTGALHPRGPCSRCAPSKTHTVLVPLRCEAEVREKRVMVVEECKCETSQEERNNESAAHTHL